MSRREKYERNSIREGVIICYLSSIIQAATQRTRQDEW